MAPISRRAILKFLGSIPAMLSLPSAAVAALRNTAEDQTSPTDIMDTPPNLPPISSRDIMTMTNFVPGYLSIIQGPTSDAETLLNVFAPRLKKYTYEASEINGNKLPLTVYETVKGPLFYNVDKMKVTGLKVGVRYILKVMDGKTVVDQRSFSALDIKKSTPNFALVSCMADDYRFTQVIDPMWARLKAEKPDFLILSGDQVYVDSFEYVERQKATEIDIWQRYTDSFRRLPLYHWLDLVPIFALWDDHDYGTNDGDKNFIGKTPADQIFHAAFGGQEIVGVWSQGPQGTSSHFTAFGQKFFMMDDRTFRQPNKDQTTQEPFGHWGQEQHQWLLQNLSADRNPAWIFNGNQFFNGVSLSYKEAFEENHPAEFATLLAQLNQLKTPVVFGSGDIHLSEVMRVPKECLGYETYEFTSSSMHSYTGTGWENPMRVQGAYTTEFNFMMIRSQNDNGGLKIETSCLGLAAQPYFKMSFNVKA
jgi:alkaline phosphatase D